MTVLIVVGSLLAVLTVACWWEARSGKPEWGAHLHPGAPTTHDASSAAKTSLAATVATAAMLGAIDAGGDGGG